MSASARKFTNRAPRYTLRPSDNHLMRFSHEDQVGQAYLTYIVDISLTGIAFVVDREQAPFIYDQIKMEFPLPDGQQIAWWGKVVRMEEYANYKWYMKKENFPSDSKILIAVQFQDLPTAHRQAIQKALSQRFEELAHEKRVQTWATIVRLWSEYTWQILLYAGVVFAAGWALWYISQPSANYDAKKGAPWGQRMWYIDPPKDKGTLDPNPLHYPESVNPAANPEPEEK